MTTAGAGYPPGALNIVGGDGGWFPMHASDWFAACSASAADLRNTKTVDDVVGTLVPVVSQSRGNLPECNSWNASHRARRDVNC